MVGSQSHSKLLRALNTNTQTSADFARRKREEVVVVGLLRVPFCLYTLPDD